jgi:Domain of unknown function (DUF4190)
MDSEPPKPPNQASVSTVPPKINIPTSRLAIASLVLGLLGFVTGVTALFGLVTGIVASRKINHSRGRLQGSGLATGGIIFSCLALGFVVLILPAIIKAKELADQINCVNNLSNLQRAIRSYAANHEGRLPQAANWCDAIAPYVGSTNTFFQCPTKSKLRCAYAYNSNLSGKTTNQVDSQTVVLFESDGGWNFAGGQTQMVTNRHHGTIVSPVDGSVRWVRSSELGTLRWNP